MRVTTLRIEDAAEVTSTPCSIVEVDIEPLLERASFNICRQPQRVHPVRSPFEPDRRVMTAPQWVACIGCVHFGSLEQDVVVERETKAPVAAAKLQCPEAAITVGHAGEPASLVRHFVVRYRVGREEGL